MQKNHVHLYNTPHVTHIIYTPNKKNVLTITFKIKYYNILCYYIGMCTPGNS